MLYGILAVKTRFLPLCGGQQKQDASRMGQYKTRYVRLAMNINTDTNTDTLSREELISEARCSKNNARVKLLEHIHRELEREQSQETAFGYNPINEMSFTGEFEAIGS